MRSLCLLVVLSGGLYSVAQVKSEPLDAAVARLAEFSRASNSTVLFQSSQGFGYIKAGDVRQIFPRDAHEEITTGGGAALSNDGKKIALLRTLESRTLGSEKCGCHEILSIYDIETGNQTDVVSTMQWFSGGLSWSPDDQQIAFFAKPESKTEVDLYVLTLKSGAMKRLSFQQENSYYATGFAGAPSWSPDGNQLSVTGFTWPQHENLVGILDLGTMEFKKLDEGIFSSWSPSGEIIYSDRRNCFSIRPDGTGKKLLFTATRTGLLRRPSLIYAPLVLSKNGSEVIFHDLPQLDCSKMSANLLNLKTGHRENIYTGCVHILGWR